MSGPTWEFCRGGPYEDLPKSTRESLEGVPGAEALVRELFDVVASGRCAKDGTRLHNGKCSWCEMFQRIDEAADA